MDINQLVDNCEDVVMNDKIIVVCPDSFDGIMCGVYHAWIIKNQQQKNGEMNVELVTGELFNFEIFTKYEYIETDIEVSRKVVRSIKKEFSFEIYTNIYRAAMSNHDKKANIIFRYLIDAYRIGFKIKDCLSIPSVIDLYELDRNVMNEQHHYLGFVRFKQVNEKLLFSTITPKNNILTLIAPHFSDRLSMENWVIYDDYRKLAVVHESNHKWVLVTNEEINQKYVKTNDQNEKEIVDLWRLFFNSIAIKERINPKLQRSNLPLKYRKHMTEVNDESV